ncbi:MAG: hypothetical protein JO233_04225 [Candidatus Eremiobacteraeota bacterium]|nr:hypothetical protein [Candidatus Eremiobacteraeota bacterium]
MLFALIAVFNGVAQAQATSKTLTVDQWRADLHYLADQMPRAHKNLFHTMTPEEFHAAVARLDADIPHLNADEITVRLNEIATMPSDSHTGGHGLPPEQCFPLRLRLSSDGIYVESAPLQYSVAVGGRLISIDGMPSATVYSKTSALVAQDPGNPGLQEVIGPVFMTAGHILHGLDVTASPDTATFEVLKNGRHVKLNLVPSVPLETLYGHVPIAGWADARGSSSPPIWLSHPEKTFWWTYLPAKKIFYIQFNAVSDAPHETVAHFFETAFTKVRKLPVDKLVLDIRSNWGGNNFLLKPIIVGLIRLPSIDRRGHLFVITSRNTYSAAQNLVNRLEFYTDAIFVGQPTGQHVNSYGDPTMIVLPNSGIRVGMASLWWQDITERDRRIETDPEIAADPTLADYVANRDPALSAIMHYRPELNLEDSIQRAIVTGSVPSGSAAYKAYAANPIHEYVLATMEARINTLGYRLLNKGRAADALAVFTVNAEANPNSANAEDSLGDGFSALGDRAKAIESYRRALQIDPKIQSSREALIRLGALTP